MHAVGGAIASRPPGAAVALGGGGLGHWIIRLFIWHEIWRFMRFIWYIPTFGPFIAVLIAAALVGLVIWRQQYSQRRRAGSWTGPRDW
jgi:hypothetical protein